MALESAEIDAPDSTEQNTVIGRMFAFVIYMNPKRGDFDQQKGYIDRCERIGKKILRPECAMTPMSWKYSLQEIQGEYG